MLVIDEDKLSAWIARLDEALDHPTDGKKIVVGVIFEKADELGGPE